MKDLKNVGWLRIVDNVEQANDDGQLNNLTVSFEMKFGGTPRCESLGERGGLLGISTSPFVHHWHRNPELIIQETHLAHSVDNMT
jgi:hypothetical protein